MTDMIQTLKTAAHKRAAYARTVRALSHLPVETQLDLGISAGDARKIAKKAVYGA